MTDDVKDDVPDQHSVIMTVNSAEGKDTDDKVVKPGDNDDLDEFAGNDKSNEKIRDDITV